MSVLSRCLCVSVPVCLSLSLTLSDSLLSASHSWKRDCTHFPHLYTCYLHVSECVVVPVSGVVFRHLSLCSDNTHITTVSTLSNMVLRQDAFSCCFVKFCERLRCRVSLRGYCSVLYSVIPASNTSQFAHGLSFSRAVRLSHVCDSLPSQVRRSDNQCRCFCAVLLGPPEEIALCALSTHYVLAAASFNLGTRTLLLRNAYVLTELFLHRIVFFCRTHLTHRCSTLIDCGFESYPILYPTMQLPRTS